MAVIAAKVAPDLGAVGNAARAPKAASAQPKELVDFTVRKGDNGGVLVTTTHKAKVPEGRRMSSGFPMTIDTKDNPFGPDDAAKATTFITGLMNQMTGGRAGGGEAEGEPATPPERPPVPPMGERPAPRPPAGGPPPFARPAGPAVARVTPNRVTAAGPGGAMTARRPLL